MQTVRTGVAMDIISRYVCARCYGQLTAIKSKHENCVDIVCGNSLIDKCNGNGFVTRNYVDRRRSESKHELWEVRENYPTLEKRQTIGVDQALSELGF